MKLATVKFLNLEILKLNNEECSRRFYEVKSYKVKEAHYFALEFL